MTDGAAGSGGKALITGAARRIGRAIAAALADRGADVAIHYNRSADAARDLAGELCAKGVRAVCLQADLGDPAQVAGLVGRAIDALGGLDILINNASVYDPDRLGDFSPEHVRCNMQINALAPIDLADQFVARARRGRIVNMLDASVIAPPSPVSAYHQSKQVLLKHTRDSAVQFAPAVRVNAVAPGLILAAPGQDAAALERFTHTNVLRRVGRVDNVVHAVLFLLENDFVTGQVIYVDGGRHLKQHMRK